MKRKRRNWWVVIECIATSKEFGKTSFVQNAWKDQAIEIHGWVFDIRPGKIIDLYAIIDEIADLDEIFKYSK